MQSYPLKNEDLLTAEYKIIVKWRCPKCGSCKQQRIPYFTIRHYKDVLKCECGCNLVIKRGFAEQAQDLKQAYPDIDTF